MGSKLVGSCRLFMSSYHTNTNGGTERVNHTMVQVLSAVTNERQTDSDLHLPIAKMSYNKSVHTATGLAPNEIHIGRLPTLRLAVFERRNACGHHRFDRDVRKYHDLLSHRL